MKKQKTKGITLIALVITIIVLLILAGVSIASLNKENEILSKAKHSKETTIRAELKEKLILSMQELQIEKKAKALLDDVTQQWLDQTIKNCECTLIEDSSINGKKVKMKKNGVVATFIIDRKLNITELEYDGNIEFSYKILQKNGINANLLITIRDKENGIKKVELPDREAMIYNGKKEEIEINYVVQLGVEYKIKITSENGEERKEIILVMPEIEVTEPIIATTTTGTTSIPDFSQIMGTPLYINFNATLGETECKIENKEDKKSIPYEITQNGVYTFIVIGMINGQTITKEVNVNVNKFKIQGGYVQYDAGDWTESEIEELKEKSQYEGYGFTFSGFTFKGNSQRTSEIETGTILTSRNDSLDDKSKSFSGWKILSVRFKNDEDGNEIKNSDGSSRIYVDSLAHAGYPEYYLHWDGDNSFTDEFVLSGGTRMLEYQNGKQGRNLEMYQDSYFSSRHAIKNIHFFGIEDAKNPDGSVKIPMQIDLSAPSIFWLATAYYNGYFGLNAWHPNDPTSWYGEGASRAFGVKPIVSLTENVYIYSGNGTKEDPYILQVE